MKALIGVATFGIVLALVTGCEWQAGGPNINTSQGEVQFSGLYSPAVAGMWLVSNYSNYGTNSPSTSTNTTTMNLGTTVAGQVSYGGSLGASIVAGSLTITIDTLPGITDNGTGGLTGTGISGGSINYQTGVFTFTLTAAPLAGLNMIATYQTATAASGITAEPGGSSVIDTFNVEQAGTSLRITDNNGSVYTGSLGAYVTLGTVNSNVSVNGVANTGGQTVSAQFEASGVSSAGMNVQMTGNFQAQNQQSVTIASDPYSTTNIVVIQNSWTRTIRGTWLEEGGRTGNINGQATPIIMSGTGSSSTSGG